MDYKPYKPFHDNGKDFVKLAVTCQVLQDMEKEEHKQGQTTISSKDVKQRTKEQEKADTYIVSVVFQLWDCLFWLRL